jgi:hypothetical protein
MLRSLTIAAPVAMLVCLSLGGCGRKPTKPPAAQQAVPIPSAVHKCPDPNIRDSTNPCSPYYWKPKGSALKSAKSF